MGGQGALSNGYRALAYTPVSQAPGHRHNSLCALLGLAACVWGRGGGAGGIKQRIQGSRIYPRVTGTWSSPQLSLCIAWPCCVCVGEGGGQGGGGVWDPQICAPKMAPSGFPSSKTRFFPRCHFGRGGGGVAKENLIQACATPPLGLKRPGVDPPLSSSRARLHIAFIAISVRCVFDWPANVPLAQGQESSTALGGGGGSRGALTAPWPSAHTQATASAVTDPPASPPRGIAHLDGPHPGVHGVSRRHLRQDAHGERHATEHLHK